MITEHSYWMNRDSRYRMEWTEVVQANGRKLVAAINKLLAYAEIDGITRDEVASGWRPKSVNDATANAGKFSTHIDANGGDVRDPGRELAQWCVLNTDKLAECGLWMEDPRWTYSENGKHWCHFQQVPPKSGKRIYIPSAAPQKGATLVGQKPIPERRVV